MKIDSKFVQFLESKLSNIPSKYQLTNDERDRLFAVLDRAPGCYQVHLDSGMFVMDEPSDLKVHHDLRDVIVVIASRFGLNTAQLGFLLIELSAALLANGMSRESFLKNAELWHDSVTISKPPMEISSKGGDS